MLSNLRINDVLGVDGDEYTIISERTDISKSEKILDDQPRRSARNYKICMTRQMRDKDV